RQVVNTKQLAQLSIRRLGARQDQDAARVQVEAVDDEQSLRGRRAVRQYADEVVAVALRCGRREQPGRLEHGDEVFVFEYDAGRWQLRFVPGACVSAGRCRGSGKCRSQMNTDALT